MITENEILTSLNELACQQNERLLSISTKLRADFCVLQKEVELLTSQNGLLTSALTMNEMALKNNKFVLAQLTTSINFYEKHIYLQPIETAPKDGTPILLYFPHKDLLIRGCWEWQGEGNWETGQQDWKDWCTDCDIVIQEDPSYAPTHWIMLSKDIEQSC
jgi:hypothetical protein